MTNHLLRTVLKRCLPPLLGLGGFSLAWGGATRYDPTQPPSAWSAAQAGSQGGAGVVAPADSAGSRLVLIGRSRKFAVIDGQVVKPGEPYNGSKVLAITPQEVVVEDASKSVNLAPGVEKKVIAPAGRKKLPRAGLKNRGSAEGSGNRQ